MKSQILILATLCAGSIFAGQNPIQTPSSGRIDRHYIYSPELQDSVTVDVWLPATYLADTTLRLPVLYMHDGQNLFDAATTWNHQSWEMDSVVTSLAEAGKITPPVIVGVHSVAETRKGDLMPVSPIANHAELKDSVDSFIGGKGLRGDLYAGFIANTLRPAVETEYRVLTGPENTSLMGSSMGGLMSMYMLCEYPEVFGSAACLSTHWIGTVEFMEAEDYRFPDAMLGYEKANLPRDGRHRIYFDHGTRTLDAWYGKWDEIAVGNAREAGYTEPCTLGYYIDQDGAHEEASWERRVHIPLQFLYGKKCDGANAADCCRNK